MLAVMLAALKVGYWDLQWAACLVAKLGETSAELKAAKMVEKSADEKDGLLVAAMVSSLAVVTVAWMDEKSVDS